MNFLKEEIITDAEAKEILESGRKDEELKYEQKNTLDVLRKFVKVDVKKIKKIVEELRSIEKLRDKQIVAIANFLPEDKNDLRTILHKEYTTFSPEEIDKILEIVKKNV